MCRRPRGPDGAARPRRTIPEPWLGQLGDRLLVGGLADGAGPDGLRWTYANIALVRGELCATVPPGTKAALGPLLYDGMRARRITVERYEGEWHNIGTPQQLAALD